jgi:hypothetical protein
MLVRCRNWRHASKNKSRRYGNIEPAIELLGAGDCGPKLKQYHGNDETSHDGPGGRRQNRTSICGEQGKRSTSRCRLSAAGLSYSPSIASR